jgi:hypothetical protein
MANVIPFSFRGELFSGTHDFASGGDSFKFALYTANPYTTASTAYSATSEVSASGTNYTTSTGTGTFNLDGAVTGFETFVAGIATGNTTYYAIFHQGTAEWEVGLGTVTDATPDTLARTTVITSSNSDSAVTFTAGTKDVFCTLPASKAVYLDASGDPVGAIANVVEDTTPQLGGNLDTNGSDIVSTSNADIDIIPNGSGDVNLGADTIQMGDNDADATVTTQGTGDLILNTNNGTNAGNVTLADGANGAITLTPNGTGVVDVAGSMNPSVSSTGKALVMGF